MATVDSNGDLQLEPGDVIPRMVAYRSDDTAEVRALIDKLNPTIKTADDLLNAITEVDELRRKVATPENKDNPHLQSEDDPA